MHYLLKLYYFVLCCFGKHRYYQFFIDSCQFKWAKIGFECHHCMHCGSILVKNKGYIDQSSSIVEEQVEQYPLSEQELKWKEQIRNSGIVVHYSDGTSKKV